MSLRRLLLTGIGSGLLRKPEIVADMVRAVKDRMGWDYDVSVKIRVDPDLKYVLRGLCCRIRAELHSYRLTERLVQTGRRA
jgi:tRNA-dihydrouridine synthase